MSRALETKQKKEYIIEGVHDETPEALRSSSLESLRVTLRREEIYSQELFQRHIRNVSEILSADPPIRQYLPALALREYNQTLLYGHSLNMDTSFITEWTVCFIPGVKKPLYFLWIQPTYYKHPVNPFTARVLGGVW